MFAPLAVRDFRLLFLGLLLGQALTPFQFVAQIIWVQLSAPEDLRIVLVGLIAAVRGAGMLLFGLYGGALADRFDRRKLLRRARRCSSSTRSPSAPRRSCPSTCRRGRPSSRTSSDAS